MRNDTPRVMQTLLIQHCPLIDQTIVKARCKQDLQTVEQDRRATICPRASRCGKSPWLRVVDRVSIRRTDPTRKDPPARRVLSPRPRGAVSAHQANALCPASPGGGIDRTY